MTHMPFIRIWQPVEIESVKKHILIVGELTASCGNCNELGLKYAEIRSCSQCGTDFLFITSREASGTLKNLGPVVKRIKDRRKDLTFVDYDDYKTVTGKQSARDFFGT